MTDHSEDHLLLDDPIESKKRQSNGFPHDQKHGDINETEVGVGEEQKQEEEVKSTSPATGSRKRLTRGSLRQQQQQQQQQQQHLQQQQQEPELYCICRSSEKGPMVGCDNCDEWFHLKCLGDHIDQKVMKRIPHYYCDPCRAALGVATSFHEEYQHALHLTDCPDAQPSKIKMSKRRTVSPSTSPSAAVAHNLRSSKRARGIDHPSFQDGSAGDPHALLVSPSREENQTSSSHHQHQHQHPLSSPDSSSHPSLSSSSSSSSFSSLSGSHSSSSFSSLSSPVSSPSPSSTSSSSSPSLSSPSPSPSSSPLHHHQPQQHQTVKRKGHAAIRPKQATGLGQVDPARFRIRQSLEQSLRANATSADSLAIIPKLAVEIEESLFEQFAGLDSEYQSKARSLLFNLRNKQNPELCQRVLRAEIAPRDLVSMDASSLASTELQKLRQIFQEESSNQHVLSENDSDHPLLFSKCETIAAPQGTPNAATSVQESFVPVAINPELPEEDDDDDDDDNDDDNEQEPQQMTDAESPSSEHSSLASSSSSSLSSSSSSSSSSLSSSSSSSETSFSSLTSVSDAHHQSTEKKARRKDKDELKSSAEKPMPKFNILSFDTFSSLEGGGDEEEGNFSPTTPPTTPPSWAYHPLGESPVREKESHHEVVWSGEMGKEVVRKFAIYGTVIIDVQTGQKPFSEIFPKTIHTKGRMDRASFLGYLNDLEKSSSTKRAALLLHPQTEDDKECYNELFGYYRSRNRVLVVSGGASRQIREMFILPLSGSDEIPSCLLDGLPTADQRDLQDILVCIAVLYDINKVKSKPSSRSSSSSSASSSSSSAANGISSPSSHKDPATLDSFSESDFGIQMAADPRSTFDPHPHSHPHHPHHPPHPHPIGAVGGAGVFMDPPAVSASQPVISTEVSSFLDSLGEMLQAGMPLLPMSTTPPSSATSSAGAATMAMHAMPMASDMSSYNPTLYAPGGAAAGAGAAGAGAAGGPYGYLPSASSRGYHPAASSSLRGTGFPPSSGHPNSGFRGGGYGARGGPFGAGRAARYQQQQQQQQQGAAPYRSPAFQQQQQQQHQHQQFQQPHHFQQQFSATPAFSHPDTSGLHPSRLSLISRGSL